MSGVREAVLSYIKAYYDKMGKAPSVNRICEEVEGLHRRKFYNLFRGGIGEACRLRTRAKA